MTHTAHAGTGAADWRARAATVVPGGCSTGSKRPQALYGTFGRSDDVPTHYDRAVGCTVVTTDGRTLLDCTMALGAVAIGYADPDVTRAVQAAAAAGPVCGLPHRLEVEVAERLAAAVPGAERVRFLRTGAEATAAAVRIARALTGRTHLVACGYFGWLDWCSDAAGVPAETRAHVTWVPFDDLTALDAAVAAHAHELAAVVLEPLVHHLPSVAWLAAARAACDRTGAVLVFDEIKTAFRVRKGGVQELLGVVPDLTALGKAMANGYPLAAVVGRAGVMEAAAHTWISSTAAAEATGLAAARAVLDWHDRVDVAARLEAVGRALQQRIGGLLAGAPALGVSADGPPWMWRLVAREEAALDALVHAAVRHGVLLKRGAYQFAALAHDDTALAGITSGVEAAIAELLDARASRPGDEGRA